MANMEFDDLLAARDLLKRSIEESRDMAVALDKTSSRLEKAGHNLPYLQAAINDVARKCLIYEIKGDVDRAIGPAIGSLKVLGLVNELQGSLETGPRVAGLFAYLNNFKRLQEAIKLLVDNCRLASTWLEDVVRILRNRACDDDGDGFGVWYFNRVSQVVTKLEELQGKGYSSEVLSSALVRLEHEYKRLVTESTVTDPFPARFSIRELQSIIEILSANERLETCISIYAEARAENARATLRALSSEYIDIQLSETVDSEYVDYCIDQWDQHMEFAVRHFLQNEHRLCNEAYGEVGPGRDMWMNCFSKIVSRCGFIEILDFGSRICGCTREAIKLPRLLRIFSTLDRLRLDFNNLFGGRFCIGIQNKTRDLVGRVVRETCDIFWELSPQVELQREWGPPHNGSVPSLVCFVIEYCNHLMEDENRLILSRVLEIHQAWTEDQITEPENGPILSFEIHNIMRAVEINLETWARSYDEPALSHLFLMNSHWYLFKRVRGTKLGELMGDSWLWAHEESSGYHAESYLRESWAKIVDLLREDGLFLFPGGRAVDRDLVQKRIRLFYQAFDSMYRKQSKWILSDKGLRWKICQVIVETIVPPYKRYLERFMPTGQEYEVDVGTNHRGESLENLIGGLFQLPKLSKHGNTKCTDLIVIKTSADHLINHFPSSPAAAC